MKDSCWLILLIPSHIAPTPLLLSNLRPVRQRDDYGEYELENRLFPFCGRSPPPSPHHTSSFPRPPLLVELPRSPLLFMSLERLTQHCPLPRLDLFSSLFHQPFLPSLPPAVSPRPTTSQHGKPFPQKVYLNPTQRFTLPRPYLNRACHLFYASADLH